MLGSATVSSPLKKKKKKLFSFLNFFLLMFSPLKYSNNEIMLSLALMICYNTLLSAQELYLYQAKKFRVCSCVLTVGVFLTLSQYIDHQSHMWLLGCTAILNFFFIKKKYFRTSLVVRLTLQMQGAQV